MEPRSPAPAVVAPPEPTGVKWYKNSLITPMRRGALLSLAIGVAMLFLASTSMVSGEVTIFTLVLIFLMFYFTDNAMGRLLVSQRAPREVGVWDGGIIVRLAKREDVIRWEEVQDMVVAQQGGRFTVLSVRTWRGEAKNYVALPPPLASELKVLWLEALARRGSRRARDHPAAASPAAPVWKAVSPAPPSVLQPSNIPAYWRPGMPEAPRPRAPAAPESPRQSAPGTPGVPPAPGVPGVPPAPGMPGVPPAPGAPGTPDTPEPFRPPVPLAGPTNPPPVAPPTSGRAPAQQPMATPTPARPRPEWSFTRIGAGDPTPDPSYPTRHGQVPSFQWHFIPSAGSPTGAWLLMAVVVLASIVISRITADLALSLLGMASDPWMATGIGLGFGLAIALVFYRLARAEMSGEVAGSVLFLPMFDRTKADIADSLRDAGLELDAGAPRVRESRGRLILTWRDAHTRAIVMRASHESRAILLRTVGRGRFGLHQRFKGAILERLRAGSAQLPPARPRH